jgi:integrase
MKVKNKIFKRKAGKSAGKWILRIEYFDVLKGKNCSVERLFDKRSDAVDKRDSLTEDLKKTHGQMVTGERMTFEQLTDTCQKVFYKPAEIAEGRKIEGVRSYRSIKLFIQNLNKFFGNRLIREITTESLFDYRKWRMSKKSERTKDNVKIATVNRELAAMRKMMRYAFGKGWILKDIFFNAKVIVASAEVERSRILTPSEEKRLLDSCQGERVISYTRKWKGKEQDIEATISVDNPHLKAMIMLAIDSGLRLGEILKLRWIDFDFDNNLIRIVGTHTKTERPRVAPLSERVKEELNNLKALTPGEKAFPYTDIKRSFATAKKIAKIDDLHFHDLRRTAVTRWIMQGSPIELAGKTAGHSEYRTTMKHYTAVDAEMVSRMAQKVNDYHSQTLMKDTVNELIN